MSTTATAAKVEQRLEWQLRGKGYEFCNCAPGCTCNFSAFPSSSDGSCRAFVVNRIDEGRCGDVDLSGLTVGALLEWPQAIHDGDGRAVFVVEPEVTDEQVQALAQIFTGQLGGNPWAILGTTFEVAGLVRAPILVSGDGLEISIAIDGVGSARGRMFRNPVTGDPHEAHIVLPDGFIWDKGECGVGDFQASAEGIDLEFHDSNWILYDFDWSWDR